MTIDDADAVPVADTTEGAGLERLLALKNADTFLVADNWGDLRSGADGLFESDTRLLSRFVMTAGGVRPSRLSSGVSRDNVFFICHSTNRPLPPMGGHTAPAGVIHMERRRFVWDRRMYERVRMVNHGIEDLLLPLAFDYAADFADIFQVRGTPRPVRGRTGTPVRDGRRVTFSYVGLDDEERQSCLAFSEPPARLSANRAEFIFSLPRGRHCDLFIECGPAVLDPPDSERWRLASIQARLAMRARRRRGASVRGPASPRFNEWLDQSRADVALLTTDLPTGPYPYAGIPWFSTPFGRDGILTAWQMLWLDPSLARGVLTYLAARQATEFSAVQDAAPGKIMHETRSGEMARLGEVPFGLYYGGVDTTCLFVALAGAYGRRTGDLDLIRRLWPNLLAAAGWMEGPGDSNGDGLIDYQRGADTGLANQGWKDSEDSIFHRDGRFPKGPIALLEVQGYAFAAWRALADMGQLLDDDRAPVWASRAETMRALVEDRFWMEDEGFYAIALDGDGNPVEARFNPMSYHNGSVWPHDTAMAVAGMARYGERAAVAMLLGEIYSAATHFRLRLPELFCGFDRMPGEAPVAYPVACLPQAWAAGSVFLLLQAALGVKIDAIEGRIEIERPVLPPGVERLTVSDIQVGTAVVDLAFQRVGGQTVVLPRNRRGGVRVVSLP